MFYIVLYTVGSEQWLPTNETMWTIEKHDKCI